MRRSSRERKTVDFYTEAPSTTTRRKINSAVVSSSEDEQSSSDEDTHRRQKRTTASKKVSRITSSTAPVHKKAKRSASSSAAAVIAKCRSKNAIFHAISSNKALPALVDKWYALYSEDNVSATATLINSLLLSAGSRDDCIPANMDLEGLDSSELEEVLSEMVTSVKAEQSRLFANKKKGSVMKISLDDDVGYPYPLGTTERKPNSFRSHFQSFWRLLLTKVLTLQQQQSSKKFNMNTIPMRILLSLAEILMALSNMSALPSVRDAVTEALLQTSATILTVCITPLRAQIAASKRQASAAAGAKLAAIQALQKKAEQSLEHYNNLVSTIFNTIFVHRYKDHFSIIRTTCAFYLGQFMLADPFQFLEGAYLKYLGWMANDKSSTVRRAVVGSLVAVLADTAVAETVSVPQRMKEFSERFIDRWVEMAVGDVDEEVAFGMIKVMREFQKYVLQMMQCT
jgi:cohesin complex subunit SA-1/2